MLISSFLQPSTGGQGQDVQRHFGLTFRQWGQGSRRQAIIYQQYPFSEQKQQEAKVKVKETDPRWTQDWLFPM